MANIEEYINKAKQAGMSSDQIKAELKKSGWPDDQIEAALSGGSTGQTAPAGGQAPFYQVSDKNRKRGLLWLILPGFSMGGVLAAYAVASFFMQSNLGSEAYGDSVAVNIMRIVIGLLGLVSVILVFYGLVQGVILLNKKELVTGGTYDARSGKGSASEIPDEIKGWNWGACGLSWIWGIYHGAWISLLVFIPYFNYIWIFVLGFKGNEWAWRARQWESVEKFKEAQVKWKPWGIFFFILFAINILIVLMGFLSFWQSGFIAS